MAKQGNAQRGGRKDADRTGTSSRAAAVLTQQKRRERRRTLIMGGVVAAVLVIVLGGAVLVANNQGSAPELGDVPAASTETGLAVGEPDAPHTVVLYEDFLCPACGAFEQASNDELTDLAADGEVLIEYRPFELLGRVGDYSKRAANAFFVVRDESGPEVAKAFHDELFANQPSESDEEFPSNDELVDMAVEAGAEEGEVRDGIESLALGDLVDTATQEAEDAGVTGTPTVVVDGESVGGSSIQEVADNMFEIIRP